MRIGQRRFSVLLLAGLVVAGIGGKKGGYDRVVLFTDEASFLAATASEPLAFPPDASTAFPDQPLGPPFVDYSCTGAFAGVDLPFGAIVPTANLSAPDAFWLCVLGPFWNGGAGNIDLQPVSPTFVVDGDDDFELAFDPPVYAVGLRLLTNFAADEVFTLTLEDGTTKAFEDDELGTDPNEFEFVGFKSLRGIVAVSVDTDGGGVQNEGIDGVESADFFQVRIDVKPGNSQNPVNCKSRGKVKVAILSEPGFSARRVDQSTLRFGATGTEPSLAFCKGKKDENRDGLKDLTCHFYTEIADFCGVSPPGEVLLTGFTLGGTPIAGSDSVWIVPGSDQPDDHGRKDKKKKKKKDKDRDDDDRDDDDDGPGRGNGYGNGNGRGNGDDD